MNRRNLRVSIIGAGVAGLTAAIALRSKGHEVAVFERQPGIKPLGAGLIMWSNAVTALKHLGVGNEVEGIGNPLTAATIRRPDGRALSRGDIAKVARLTGSPTIAVHRADLLHMLKSRLPDYVFHFDHNLGDLGIGEASVVSSFANGHEHETDVLIGADGIWSTVRSSLHGSVPPKYSGYTAWRGISRLPERYAGSGETSETWGRGSRFGWVPLSEGRVYWFATKNASEGQQAGPGGHREELVRLFGSWHEPIPEAVESIVESEILRHDIYDRTPRTDWGTGHITLVGDAAHPMTPNLGQGAATGIEDGVVLAHCLERYQTVAGALRAYEATRRARTDMIVTMSRRVGRVAQLDSPLSSRLRDAAMRVIPDRISQRQFEQIASWRPPEGGSFTVE